MAVHETVAERLPPESVGHRLSKSPRDAGGRESETTAGASAEKRRPYGSRETLGVGDCEGDWVCVPSWDAVAVAEGVVVPLAVDEPLGVVVPLAVLLWVMDLLCDAVPDTDGVLEAVGH